MEERLSGLLLRHRGRVGLTQRELASRVGVHMRSVQDWEAGVNFPSAERLQQLIAAFLETGALTTGAEEAEACELWDAALRESSRMRTPFDRSWFDQLSSEPKAPASAPTTVDARRHDWGDSPDVPAFVGRAEELARLSDWVLEEHCRVLAIVGMGGIGKTTLAAQLARQVAPNFERVYWRSLRDAISAHDWMGQAITFISAGQVLPPQCKDERFGVLLQLLRERSTLLMLDNLETLLAPGDRSGGYREEYGEYGRLLKAIAEGRHRSCLVVTSREAPPELALFGDTARVLKLGGLGLLESQALLVDKQLSGDTEDWVRLIARYGGNSLALKLIGETIRQLFGGDIAEFLEESASVCVYGGIRRLLAEQIERSSIVEKDVLKYMALVREPATLVDLITELGPRAGRAAVLEAVEALRRRSLLECAEKEGAVLALKLQSVVLEYVTDNLTDPEVVEFAQVREPLTLQVA